MRWEKFKINFRYRLDLIRIYRVPILILSIGLAIIIPLSIDLYNRFPELTQAFNNVPTTTLNTHLITPSQTLVPSQTRTKLPNLTLPPTKTKTPTLTPTFTPVPRSSILFQKDFEDGAVGASSKDGVWAVEQEPGGNHCLSGSGPAVGTPQIWYYKQKQTRLAYALEIRVKFIQGHTLYIIFPSNDDSSEHYGVALNDNGLSLMRTWSMIGKNFPMLPYPDRWYTFKVEIKGDSLSVYIDNLLFEEYPLQPPLIDQYVIGYVIDDGDKVCFDDIKVWSLK